MAVNREHYGLNVSGSEEYLKRRAKKAEQIVQRNDRFNRTYDKADRNFRETLEMGEEDEDMRRAISRAKAAREFLAGLRGKR